ncbi:hypothetical protein HK099_007189 [Clydaea vesicula]|uniref:Uncharacterized protein n=1 Tax=Clydaea vesicula TaxID=447962 RepID=A0AAD5TXD3_9FUNG|nr:hypothetical protein HK099_007189 [Clydaea vesicula]
MPSGLLNQGFTETGADNKIDIPEITQKKFENLIRIYGKTRDLDLTLKAFYKFKKEHPKLVRLETYVIVLSQITRSFKYFYRPLKDKLHFSAVNNSDFKKNGNEKFFFLPTGGREAQIFCEIWKECESTFGLFPELFLPLLNFHVVKGDINTVQLVLRDMESKNLRPTIQHYNLILQDFTAFKAHRPDQIHLGIKLFENLEKRGLAGEPTLTPDEESLQLMILGCSKRGMVNNTKFLSKRNSTVLLLSSLYLNLENLTKEILNDQLIHCGRLPTNQQFYSLLKFNLKNRSKFKEILTRLQLCGVRYDGYILDLIIREKILNYEFAEAFEDIKSLDSILLNLSLGHQIKILPTKKTFKIFHYLLCKNFSKNKNLFLLDELHYVFSSYEKKFGVDLTMRVSFLHYILNGIRSRKIEFLEVEGLISEYLTKFTFLKKGLLSEILQMYLYSRNIVKAIEIYIQFTKKLETESLEKFLSKNKDVSELNKYIPQIRAIKNLLLSNFGDSSMDVEKKLVFKKIFDQIIYFNMEVDLPTIKIILTYLKSYSIRHVFDNIVFRGDLKFRNYWSFFLSWVNSIRRFSGQVDLNRYPYLINLNFVSRQERELQKQNKKLSYSKVFYVFGEDRDVTEILNFSFYFCLVNEKVEELEFILHLFILNKSQPKKKYFLEYLKLETENFSRTELTRLEKRKITLIRKNLISVKQYQNFTKIRNFKYGRLGRLKKHFLISLRKKNTTQNIYKVFKKSEKTGSKIFKKINESSKKTKYMKLIVERLFNK